MLDGSDNIHTHDNKNNYDDDNNTIIIIVVIHISEKAGLRMMMRYRLINRILYMYSVGTFMRHPHRIIYKLKLYLYMERIKKMIFKKKNGKQENIQVK